MRKRTKQILISVFLVLVFGFSTFAFVGSGIYGTTQNQQIKPLESFVVNGQIDPQVENAYLQAGFTFMKIYAPQDSLISNAFDTYPERFAATTGQQQIIVQKILSEQEKIEIINFNAVESVNGTSELAVIPVLCRTVVSTPLECALISQVGETNTTTNETSP